MQAQSPVAFKYTQQNVMACDACGQLQSVPLKSKGQSANSQKHSNFKQFVFRPRHKNDLQLFACTRCAQPLVFRQTAWREKTAALVITALILFVVANSFVFLGLDVGAFYHEANFLSSVLALARHHQISLAIFVFVTNFLFPVPVPSIVIYGLAPLERIFPATSNLCEGIPVIPIPTLPREVSFITSDQVLVLFLA